MTTTTTIITFESSVIYNMSPPSMENATAIPTSLQLNLRGRTSDGSLIQQFIWIRYTNKCRSPDVLLPNQRLGWIYISDTGPTVDELCYPAESDPSSNGTQTTNHTAASVVSSTGTDGGDGKEGGASGTLVSHPGEELVVVGRADVNPLDDSDNKSSGEYGLNYGANYRGGEYGSYYNYYGGQYSPGYGSNYYGGSQRSKSRHDIATNTQNVDADGESDGDTSQPNYDLAEVVMDPGTTLSADVILTVCRNGEIVLAPNSKMTCFWHVEHHDEEAGEMGSGCIAVTRNNTRDLSQSLRTIGANTFIAPTDSSTTVSCTNARGPKCFLEDDNVSKATCQVIHESNELPDEEDIHSNTRHSHVQRRARSTITSKRRAGVVEHFQHQRLRRVRR
jgi:hypothetical protein